MALLEVRGLSRLPWFQGRDLDIEAGAVVVASGPTGSGKTLLLRAIADLDAADAGTVRLDGTPREAMEPRAWRRRVLYVHQAGVRLPGTVRENLERIRDLTPRPGEVPDVPGLDPQADADRLSGGERQALALHRALLCEPRVLLLDESTSAMDAATASTWEARVCAWAAEGRGVLWVAHDAGLARRLGARVETFP